MKTRKRVDSVLIASIFLLIAFACPQNWAYAAESGSSGGKNGEKLLSIKFTYQKTGQTVNVNGVEVQVSSLSGFALKDAETNEEIPYEKLVVAGKKVIGSRVYAEPGANGMNMVEFSFEGGEFKSYGAPMMQSISRRYTLENGTLTLLD